MYKINNAIETKIEIKKSIFITNLIPVASISEAQDALKVISKKYYDATHNCYSYIIGDGNTYKYQDDGEPSQTAGIVIYNCLKNNNITNVICVVTRYFGGIKLGAGGLVRAYANATSEAINNANLVEIIEYKNLAFSFDYTYTTQILKLLSNEEKLNQEYKENVFLEYRVPISKYEDYVSTLINLTNGTVKIH